MAGGAGVVTVRILGDADQFKKSIADVDGKTSKLGSSFTKMAGLAAGAFAAAGVGSMVKGALDAASEAMKVSAQTEAVVKSTGAAAGVTSTYVGDLAHTLQNLSGVSDEAIQTGQNMLLTFTNIKDGVGANNKVFTEATKTMLDMSVATGTDAKNSALQLGKALNDPVKGISALSRVGVTFTEQQKEQIKTMVAAGDTAGAQKVILAELSKEFGGSAAAAGAAMTPMEKLSMRFGDIQEAVGVALIPIIEKLSAILTDTVIPVIQGFAEKLDAWKVPLLAIGGVITAVMLPHLASLAAAAVTSAVTQAAAWVSTQAAAIAAAVTHSAQVVLQIGKWIALGAASLASAAQVAAAWLISMGPIVLVGAAVAGLVVLIVKNWATITRVTRELWEGVKNVTAALWEGIKTAVSNGVAFLTNLFLNFTGPGLIIKHFDTIVGFVTEMPGRIAAAASGMWDGLKDAFRSAVNWIIGKWNDLKLTLGGQKVDLPFGMGFDIPSITLRTPNIPTLHDGGVYRAPTPGGEGLALLKDGETVLPAKVGTPWRPQPSSSASATIIRVDLHGSRATDLITVDDALTLLRQVERQTGFRILTS
jgi:hypothetical protein